MTFVLQEAASMTSLSIHHHPRSPWCHWLPGPWTRSILTWHVTWPWMDGLIGGIGLLFTSSIRKRGTTDCALKTHSHQHHGNDRVNTARVQHQTQDTSNMLGWRRMRRGNISFCSLRTRWGISSLPNVSMTWLRWGALLQLLKQGKPLCQAPHQSPQNGWKVFQVWKRPRPM